jgi:DNA-directed RNA polymerase subunit RPC12/RpoP
MEKGKLVIFDCTWCEKEVQGHLTLEIRDFVKNVTRQEYTCPNCPHRVTRKEIEGCNSPS